MEKDPDSGKVRKKKGIRILVAVLLILFAVFVCNMILSVRDYIDTHTWATLRIVESVETDTSDVGEDSVEFLKGETYSLHATKFTVEDISSSGTVTLSFSPAVRSSNGETTETAVIIYGGSFSFREDCEDGASASATIQVVSHRYQ